MRYLVWHLLISIPQDSEAATIGLDILTLILFKGMINNMQKSMILRNK